MEATRQITPLSTLVITFTGSTGTLAQVQAAETQIKQALGLASTFALLTTDPIALARSVTASQVLRADALTVFKRNVQLANVVLSAQALSSAADVLVSDRTLNTLRLLIQNGNVDLTNVTQLQALLSGGAGVVVPAELITRTRSANLAVANSDSTTAVGTAQKAHADSLRTTPPGSVTPTDPTDPTDPVTPTDPSQVQPVFDQLCNVPGLGQALVDLAQNGDPTIADCPAGGDAPVSLDALQSNVQNLLANCTNPASPECQSAFTGNLGALTALCDNIPEGTPEQLVDGCNTLTNPGGGAAGGLTGLITTLTGLFSGAPTLPNNPLPFP